MGVCLCSWCECGLADKDVKERAQWLLNHPVMTELDLPEKSEGGPARKLLSKLRMDGDEDRDK